VKTAVIGDGGWGTTLAILLAGKGGEIALWSVFPKYAEHLQKTRENTKFLPGISLPENIQISSDIQTCVEGAGVLVLAPPSHFMREVSARLKGIDLSQKILVSVSKGIENDSLMRMSEVVYDVLGKDVQLGVLSGPTIAPEVAKKLPAMAVIASPDENISHTLQTLFTTETFGIYLTDDVIGVEVGGSLKNVIAIAAGIADGLGLGTNTKAALFTRGLVEITRLGMKMGARLETFSGLSGMGDLVTTCLSPKSRNRSFGEAIGRGKKLEEILKETEMVVEGVKTTGSTLALGKKHKVELPITEEIQAVLYGGKDPLQAVKDLMDRRRGEEFRLIQ